MRTLLRLAALVVCATALSACISLLPKGKPAQLYRFGPVPSAGAPATHADRRSIAVFRSNGSFQSEAADDRMLTVTDGKAAYIAASRWVAPAPILFEQAVGQAFDASPIRLLVRGQQGRAAYALRMTATPTRLWSCAYMLRSAGRTRPSPASRRFRPQSRPPRTASPPSLWPTTRL